MRYANFLLILCLLPVALLAQFDGGEGDGYSRRTTIQLDLEGIPAGTRALYSGGSGDGFHSASESSSLSGITLVGIYSGGQGDGYANFRTSATLAGENLAQIFSGGAGDGYAALRTSLSLNGASLANIYAGGQGDGYADLSKTLFLDGEELTSLFAGGAGDGYASLAHASGLMGFSPSVLYSGGAGDGYDHNRTSRSLNGEDQAVLYSGGDGDGFDVARYEGIIPLPLTLISFDAFPETDYVLLKWVTEDEVATDFFTVEKTKDGRDFAWVGETPAAGYSEPGEQIHYEMRDEHPYDGTSYYRLETTDFDGAISYSQLVAVNFANARGWDFTLFPNPNTGRHFSVKMDGVETGERVNLAVTDAQGRVLLREQITYDPANPYRFDFQHQLPPGSYLIRLDQRQETQAKLLIVGRR